MRFKNILCATDLSDFSNHALLYGVRLARKPGTRLFVCHIVTRASGHGSPKRQSQEQRIRAAIDQLTTQLSDQPIDWEPIIESGAAVEKISEIVETRHIDLTIAATHGRSGMRRLILGSVVERLMHTLQCPLLIVNRPENDFKAAAQQPFDLGRILVGCDFSPDSRLAFDHGLQLAQTFHAELHLVHVIEPPVYKEFLDSAHSAGVELKQILLDRLNEKLSALVPSDARNTCTLQTTLLNGKPFEELMTYAQKHQVDLIALGIRGHSLVENLLIGSTTDRMVRRAPCPVLAVRPIKTTQP